MKKLPTTILFTISMMVATSYAATLIQDNFNRTGPLSGTAPSFSTTSALWTGQFGVFTTNSTVALTNPSGSSLHNLATPTLLVNTKYELSVFMENQSGSNSTDWLGFGFGADAPTGAGLILEGTGKSYVYDRTVGVSSPTVAAPRDRFTITLTTGASLANSQIAYARAGTGVIGTPHSVDATTFGSSIYLQTINGLPGFYDDLLLTSTPVPEPSSLMLLGLATFGLIRRRR